MSKFFIYVQVILKTVINAAEKPYSLFKLIFNLLFLKTMTVLINKAQNENKKNNLQFKLENHDDITIIDLFKSFTLLVCIPNCFTTLSD